MLFSLSYILLLFFLSHVPLYVFIHLSYSLTCLCPCITFLYASLSLYYIPLRVFILYCIPLCVFILYCIPLCVFILYCIPLRVFVLVLHSFTCPCPCNTFLYVSLSLYYIPLRLSHCPVMCVFFLVLHSLRFPLPCIHIMSFLSFGLTFSTGFFFLILLSILHAFFLPYILLYIFFPSLNWSLCPFFFSYIHVCVFSFLFFLSFFFLQK